MDCRDDGDPSYRRRESTVNNGIEFMCMNETNLLSSYEGQESFKPLKVEDALMRNNDCRYPVTFTLLLDPTGPEQADKGSKRPAVEP
jgi:hypothetical protein